MAEGERPRSRQLQGAWGQVGRSVIQGWVTDLGRYLDRTTSALARARRFPLKERGIAALEESLWRLDASREKLHAVLTLTLGVRHLDLTTDPIGFKVDPKRIGTVLRGMGHTKATKLDRLGKRLAEHPAINLRNQLSHGVAPLTDVRVRCFFEAVAIRKNSIGIWRSHVDYPPGWRAHGDIKDTTMWAGAVSASSEALDMLCESVRLLADLLVETSAKLPAPAHVYRDVDSGRLTLHDPRSA
jgi:hypothetical protein